MIYYLVAQAKIGGAQLSGWNPNILNTRAPLYPCFVIVLDSLELTSVFTHNGGEAVKLTFSYLLKNPVLSAFNFQSLSHTFESHFIDFGLNNLILSLTLTFGIWLTVKRKNL